MTTEPDPDVDLADDDAWHLDPTLDEGMSGCCSAIALFPGAGVVCVLFLAIRHHCRPNRRPSAILTA